LPIQATVRFELVVNLKAAKTIALDLPPTLLAGGDEAIDPIPASGRATACLPPLRITPSRSRRSFPGSFEFQF